MSAITTRNSRKRTMSPSNTKAFKSPQEMMPPPTLKRLKRTYNNSSKHNIMENKNIINKTNTSKNKAVKVTSVDVKKQQNILLKQAVVLRVAILYRAIRGDVSPRSKNYNNAVSAGIPPIVRGWRERLSKSLNEKRFDLILRILAEAYVACSIDKDMTYDEKLEFIRSLDAYYLQTLEISKIDQVDPVTLKDSSAALTKKISELALAITNIILNLGLGRLINMDKKTRALFMQLQHIVKKASDTGRNSSVIEMGRSLLTLIFLDDRLEGKNLSSEKSSHSLKQMISMILDTHALTLLHEEK